MKTSELMQGDIILYEYEGQKIPARVVEIYRYSVLVESVSGEYEPIEIDEDKIFPVEPTSEILEKNGFERGSDNLFSYGRGMYVMMWSKGHYSVGQIFGNWSAFVEFAEIRFFHELQHALRLCGIEKEITI